ncbi:uncharacterized protein PHACADRAFT_251029 [Phanerochaete carnosa HHB-10118-sp]|uniref:Uncharacterized protein n=1 Tax=Phanerochaete carnosa (strain HHB-10118-sp) TaxID=650164 RepID=K5XB14_PHACS|nr:uncharacterized protein PHACADRAFT_251029 [Phanerochaete carnosa HHB-10118-sp]EKM60132.1 hypothetical protein PHACADRAFT_251029 [Phanerochaete carnosa HHB-10118-sp]
MRGLAACYDVTQYVLEDTATRAAHEDRLRPCVFWTFTHLPSMLFNTESQDTSRMCNTLYASARTTSEAVKTDVSRSMMAVGEATEDVAQVCDQDIAAFTTHSIAYQEDWSAPSPASHFAPSKKGLRQAQEGVWFEH